VEQAPSAQVRPPPPRDLEGLDCSAFPGLRWQQCGMFALLSLLSVQWEGFVRVRG
jgi:hypothetical protein